MSVGLGEDRLNATLTVCGAREGQVQPPGGKAGIRPGPNYADGMPLELFEGEPVGADGTTPGNFSMAARMATSASV